MYEGLVVGRDVTLGRGATLRVVKGGRMVIGDGSRIEAGCDLVSYGLLEIGPRAFVGRGSILVATDRISIGADAVISQDATLCASTHDVQDPLFPLVIRPIRIGAAGIVLLLRARDQVLSVSFFMPAYRMAAALTRSAFSPGSACAAP